MAKLSLISWICPPRQARRTEYVHIWPSFQNTALKSVTGGVSSNITDQSPRIADSMRVIMLHSKLFSLSGLFIYPDIFLDLPLPSFQFVQFSGFVKVVEFSLRNWG